MRGLELEAGQERRGEGRMAADGAVGGELAGEGRGGDEERAVFLGDAREAAEAAARARRARRALREGVVAAGVEEDDLLAGARPAPRTACRASTARRASFGSQVTSMSVGAMTFLPPISMPWPA